MIGHVATPIRVSQISTGRKGRKIHNEAAMSPTVKTTASVVHGRSCWMRDTGSCDTASVAKIVSTAGGRC